MIHVFLYCAVYSIIYLLHILRPLDQGGWRITPVTMGGTLPGFLPALDKTSAYTEAASRISFQ
jgi:hypothetical protein